MKKLEDRPRPSKEDRPRGLLSDFARHLAAEGLSLYRVKRKFGDEVEILKSLGNNNINLQMCLAW